MYNINNDKEVDNNTVLKDREQIHLCLKDDDSVSVHLRQNKIIERSLKIKVNINPFSLY